MRRKLTKEQQIHRRLERARARARHAVLPSRVRARLEGRLPDLPAPVPDLHVVPDAPAPRVQAAEPSPSEQYAEQAVSNLARWQREPWTFGREVLGFEPDDFQDEFLHALVGLKMDGTPLENPRPMLCLKACKGPGKTAVLAVAILWFMTCFVHPKILVTSVTAENLRDNLWTELAMWIHKSPMLGLLLVWQGERIYARDHQETWWCSARTWPKDADKNKQANTLAGLHGKNTMLVVDEGGTIPPGVLAAGLAHHATQEPDGEPETHLTLMAGNPDQLDGALGWACTEDAKNWWVKEITGDPDDPRRAKRVDVTWAREQIEKYGRDNPWVLVNVFGKFPPAGSDKFIGPDAVRAAMEVVLPEPLWHDQPRVMALDVARSLGRDQSVLGRRQGPVVFPFIQYRIADLNDLAGQVAFEYARWPAKLIIVDIAGVGAGVYDHLKALSLPVVGFNGGVPARDPRFRDRRTEAAFWVCQEIKGRGNGSEIALPTLPELISEMTTPNIEWNERGQMKMESKDKLLKRGFHSPDIFDCLCMLYAEPVFADTEISETTRQMLAQTHGAVTMYDPFKEEGQHGAP